MIQREEGQIIPLLAVGMLLLLLGVAGLVVDVGNISVAQRKVQAVADAAALAGAAVLPDTAQAVSTAEQYGATGTNAAALTGLSVAQPTPQPWCLNDVSYCYDNAVGGPPTIDPSQANGLVVHETATVKTTFMRLFGFSSVTVHATATACGLCGSVPLNIALVVDRTGSMSDNMTDLRTGVDTFLGALNPALDWVSLLVLPPAPGGSACVPAADGAYPYQGSSYPSDGDDAYVVVSQSHDYSVNGSLNTSSKIVQQVGCMKAQGGTAYKQALEAAESELQSYPASRQDYPDVIVFETDGAANTAPDSWYDRSTAQQDGRNGPTFYKAATGHENDILEPCGSAVSYADSLKSSGVTVMTVGYDTGQDNECYEAPHYSGKHGYVDYKQILESTTAESALQEMASPNDSYFASSESTSQTMQAAFAQIGGKLAGAKLVPDSDAE